MINRAVGYKTSWVILESPDIFYFYNSGNPASVESRILGIDMSQQSVFTLIDKVGEFLRLLAKT